MPAELDLDRMVSDSGVSSGSVPTSPWGWTGYWGKSCRCPNVGISFEDESPPSPTYSQGQEPSSRSTSSLWMSTNGNLSCHRRSPLLGSRTPSPPSNPLTEFCRGGCTQTITVDLPSTHGCYLAKPIINPKFPSRKASLLPAVQQVPNRTTWLVCQASKPRQRCPSQLGLWPLLNRDLLRYLAASSVQQLPSKTAPASLHRFGTVRSTHFPNKPDISA
jgi:hypothetical protein